MSTAADLTATQWPAAHALWRSQVVACVSWNRSRGPASTGIEPEAPRQLELDLDVADFPIRPVAVNLWLTCG